MEGCDNSVVFTKRLIIARGVSELSKTRRDSGALSGTCGWESAQSSSAAAGFSRD